MLKTSSQQEGLTYSAPR